MRIGYSFWGFLGDHRWDKDGTILSTPDGNATYSWSIIWEALRRGHEVVQVQEDRDWPAVKCLGPDNFLSFSQYKRWKAYDSTLKEPGTFPRLDVLLLEWRFPIPKRNCFVSEEGTMSFGFGLQPDLMRQQALLEYYKGKDTKIVLWDLDHKLTEEDERFYKPDAIFETSVQPRLQFVKRTRVEPPFVMDDLLQFEMKPVDHDRKLVYVGSRYERDDVIDQYIKPVSDAFPKGVHFHGNWLNTLADCQTRWPNVQYNGRITPSEFGEAYNGAVACPLLAKRSYFQTGFITPRPWEALLFGTIPVGFKEHLGIKDYVTTIAESGEDLADAVYSLSVLPQQWRESLRRENADMLRFMDASKFLDTLEAV